MECWEDFIGINDGCSTAIYKHLLDDYGISIYSAGKIADERFKTGAELIKALIKRGFNDTFDQILFSGMDANKIVMDHKMGVADCSETLTGGAPETIFKTGGKGKMTEWYVPYIYVNVVNGGQTTISVTAGGVTTELYNGVAADNTLLKIKVGMWLGQEFKLTIDLTNITVCKTVKDYNNCVCSCESFTIDGDLNGLIIDLQIRCNKKIYLCKYADIISDVAIHRVAGLFWNEVLTTNRFSEFKQFKKEDAPGQLVYHDSSFPITIDGELKFSPVKGQFQVKLKSLSIPAPKCKCCMQCKGGSQVVTAYN